MFPHESNHTTIDVTKLIEWLGPEGAVAGLERSHITNADLMVIAREKGKTVEKRTPRKQIIIEIVMGDVRRVEKPTEYLLSMSSDELNRYFTERLVSDSEILSILKDLGIPPKGKIKSKSKFKEYAANEISDLGMLQRVAKGRNEKKSQ